VREIHNFEQGSDSWHSFRSVHFGASEASAMLGISPYKKRDDLLLEKATGISKEVNSSTQLIFDNGHRVENLARPLVENIIGVELYPVTVSRGKLSASCDGLSLCETIAWENKQFNAKHFEQVKNGELPEIHWPQCQQVLHVTGAEKIYFTISDGTPEKTVGIWVYQDKNKIQNLIDGWGVFENDLSNFVAPVSIEKVEAATIQALPVPSIVVKGEITVSNLEQITPVFDTYLANIKTELTSDEDFADAEANGKNCREMATRIKSLRANIIAQMVDVNAVDGVLANYEDAFNKVGLKLENAVKAQKETIKTNAVLKTRQEYFSHIQALDTEIAPIRLNLQAPDFAGSFKGVKSIATMHSRLNDALANGKIEADAMARDIRNKLANFKLFAKDNEFLFHDLASIIQKPIEDFHLVINTRISAHKEAELAKEVKIKAEAEAALLAKQAAETVVSQHPEIIQEQVKSVVNTGLSVTKASVGLGGDLQLKHIATSEIRTQYFEGVSPTANELVCILAAALHVDERMAHKWLIETDFTEYKIAA